MNKPNTKRTVSGTAKVPCKCTNDYQDRVYGRGVRIANATQKGDDASVDVRCTVCSTLHRVSKSRVNA